MSRPRLAKQWWSRTIVWHLLQNPAYKGQAAYGKTRTVTRRQRLRPLRGRPIHPRHDHSTAVVDQQDWISIQVPEPVDESLFDAAQEPLREDRTRAREGRRHPGCLLQGFKGHPTIRRLELGASIAEVARACEVNPNVLHRWRRELREQAHKRVPAYLEKDFSRSSRRVTPRWARFSILWLTRVNVSNRSWRLVCSSWQRIGNRRLNDLNA